MNRQAITQLLTQARQQGYAIGSFSPRNTVLIPAILAAATAQRSPVIIQISSNEFKWFEITPKEFAAAFYKAAALFDIPAVLHLDHTYELSMIKEAIDCGFQSVMFDGSKHPFEDNIRLTRQAAELAHSCDVFLEAELGNIGGTDTLETGGDHQHYTQPAQAEEFVEKSGCDSLAISVGTAHGVYPVANPTIDFDRLGDIAERVSIPLVLHGGSGLPATTVHHAISMKEHGGISKLNLATDLELTFQKATGQPRLPEHRLRELNPALLKAGAEAVTALCEDRMVNFLLSAGKA